MNFGRNKGEIRNSKQTKQIGCTDMIPIPIDNEDYSCFFSNDGDFLYCMPKMQWLTKDKKTMYVKRKNNLLKIYDCNTHLLHKTIDLTRIAAYH